MKELFTDIINMMSYQILVLYFINVYIENQKNL